MTPNITRSQARGKLSLASADPAAKPLLDKAGVEPDEGVTALGGFVEAAKHRFYDREPGVRTLA